MQTIHDIVTLKNIDGEDFEFMYDKHPYFIPAGQVRRFPRFLAEHGLKHLIDKMLNKQQLKTSDEVQRARLAQQIVVNVETFEEPPAKSQAELTAERVADMNKPSDLDALLKSHKEPVNQQPYQVKVDERGHETVVQPTAAPVTPPAAPQAPTTPAAPATTTNDTEEGADEFAGLKDQNQPTPPTTPTTPEVKAMPSKAELLKYAADTLKMNLADDKTKKALERMTVPQLIKELDYPMGE